MTMVTTRWTVTGWIDTPSEEIPEIFSFITGEWFCSYYDRIRPSDTGIFFLYLVDDADAMMAKLIFDHSEYEIEREERQFRTENQTPKMIHKL